MYCDALTLAAVADELDQNLTGGRVQGVLLVAPYMLGIEVYHNRERHYLVMAANPAEGGRIHLSQSRLRRGVEVPSPLLLRLRKLATGGRIVAVHQPRLDRLLRVTIHGGAATFDLVVEVMGRYSNLVLVGEDGSILECMRRIPARQNRYRVLLPGYAYVEPPQQDKAGVDTLTLPRLGHLLMGAEADPLWKRLVLVVRGMSPLLAREVVHRACGNCRATEADPVAVLDACQELMSLGQTRQWQPCLGLEGSEVAAYAPYELTHLPDRCHTTTISEAMDRYHSQQNTVARQGAVPRDSYRVARAKVSYLVEQARAKLLRKRDALVRAQQNRLPVEQLRAMGEALLAFAHEIPRQQTEWRLSWGDPAQPLVIPLDPSLSAVENARQYFHQYDKAKSAAAEVPALLVEVDGEMAYLDQLRTDLSLAENYPEIAAVEVSLTATGHVPGRKRLRHPVGGPRRVLSEEGFVILVGRNSLQNDELTFGKAMSRDMWLHAHGVPGAHVLVKADGRDVPQATVQRAAELAAYYSAGRQESRVMVDYTWRKHVRRLRGGRPGQVLLRQAETLSVTPRP